jgi:hypothetical protein
MKDIQQMSSSTIQFQLLDLSLSRHHRVVSHHSPREVAKPSANHLPDEDTTVLLVCEIVLGDVMMGGEEALAVSIVTVVYARPSQA